MTTRIEDYAVITLLHGGDRGLQRLDRPRCRGLICRLFRRVFGSHGRLADRTGGKKHKSSRRYRGDSLF